MVFRQHQKPRIAKHGSSRQSLACAETKKYLHVCQFVEMVSTSHRVIFVHILHFIDWDYSLGLPNVIGPEWQNLT